MVLSISSVVSIGSEYLSFVGLHACARGKTQNLDIE